MRRTDFFKALAGLIISPLVAISVLDTQKEDAKSVDKEHKDVHKSATFEQQKLIWDEDLKARTQYPFVYKGDTFLGKDGNMWIVDKLENNNIIMQWIDSNNPFKQTHIYINLNELLRSESCGYLT